MVAEMMPQTSDTIPLIGNFQYFISQEQTLPPNSIQAV